MTTPRALKFYFARTLANRLGWSYCGQSLPNLKTVGCMRRAADILFDHGNPDLQILPLFTYGSMSRESMTATTTLRLCLDSCFRIIYREHTPTWIPSNPGSVQFTAAPFGQSNGCGTGLPSTYLLTGGGTCRMGLVATLLRGCPTVQSTLTSSLSAEYIIHSSDGLCMDHALTNAHRLFCLIETASAQLASMVKVAIVRLRLRR